MSTPRMHCRFEGEEVGTLRVGEEGDSHLADTRMVKYCFREALAKGGELARVASTRLGQGVGELPFRQCGSQ